MAKIKFQPCGYHRVLLDGALEAAKKWFPRKTVKIENAFRNDASIFIVNDEASIALKVGKERETVRYCLKTNTYRCGMDFETWKPLHTYQVGGQFLMRLKLALNEEFKGRDLFKEKLALEKRPWFKGGNTAKDQKDNLAHSAIDGAMCLYAFSLKPGEKVRFEYQGKIKTGTFTGIKIARKRHPEGDDTEMFGVKDAKFSYRLWPNDVQPARK